MTKISSTHHPLDLPKFYTLISLIFFRQDTHPLLFPYRYTYIIIAGHIWRLIPYISKKLSTHNPYFSKIFSAHHFIPYKHIPYKKSVMTHQALKLVCCRSLYIVNCEHITFLHECSYSRNEEHTAVHTWNEMLVATWHPVVGVIKKGILFWVNF